MCASENTYIICNGKIVKQLAKAPRNNTESIENKKRGSPVCITCSTVAL